MTFTAPHPAQLASLPDWRYKTPREIIALAGLPKNPVGKIDKPALRRMVG